MITERNPFAVAIDGPSGAGKSTIAQQLARELGFVYVDTGALYRSIGYAALSRGVDPSDVQKVPALLPSLSLELRYADGAQQVWMNGEDVSDRIRTPEVSMAASAVSAMPPVRQYLFDLQRDMARTGRVIMDGRDIGTVVLPDAKVKIFLTASAEVRARRRYDELRQKGMEVDFNDVLRELEQRDYDDSHRAVAPLKAADDAVVIDTSDCDFDQSVERLKTVILERL